MSPQEPPVALYGPPWPPEYPPGDPRRWTPCSRCPHLRIEHAPGLKRCEVREDPRDPRTRCLCRGYQPITALPPGAPVDPDDDPDEDLDPTTPTAAQVRAERFERDAPDEVQRAAPRRLP